MSEIKEHHIRCQSCGTQIADESFGTEASGSPAKEWCKLCYQNGVFVDPGLTMADMMKMSMRRLTHGLKMSDEQAEVLAHSIIPQLKRWKK
jgi:hypothetical protein